MVDGGKYTVITNGFDEDEMPQLVNLKFKKNKIIIGYVGSFYYTPEYRDNIFRPWWKKPLHRMLNYVPRKEDWLYRSPFYFFKTIQSILDKHQDWKERVEIRFAGSTPKWLIDQIKAFGLENNCRHYGHLNHDDVISFQKGCDALLITSSKVIDGRDYSIAGKTFEYFTIGKPILAFVCDGVQKDLLQQSGSAVMFNPDDNKQSVTTMLQFFNGNIKLNPDMSFIKQHHRKNLTKKLAGVIREITTKNL